ncbi:MAG: hypothetical protein JXA57_14190 [Armatimonadetes bacterium]|nr:hypothetical protein [Armatimonadota bacterium]
MTHPFTESTVEEAALSWLAELGYAVKFGPEIAPGEPAAERDDYGHVVLAGRLRAALKRLNPKVPVEALNEALRKVTRPATASLTANMHVTSIRLVPVPIVTT